MFMRQYINEVTLAHPGCLQSMRGGVRQLSKWVRFTGRLLKGVFFFFFFFFFAGTVHCMVSMFEVFFLMDWSLKVARGGKMQRTDCEGNEDAC